MRWMRWMRLALGALVTSLVTVTACSSDGGSSSSGKGSVQIFVVPEDSIAQGLEPGADEENIQDGWTITYDRYLVTIGNFRARRTDTNATLVDPTIWVLDLKGAPTSGYVTTVLDDVDAVRWDKFGYDVANAAPGVKTMAPTKQADVDLMVANGWSVYFEGHGEKDGKRIAFAWGFRAGTSFDDCASPDGITGFAVPKGGTVQVKPTLHGDHQFFDNVTQGVEITKRLAQWLETCDADDDQNLTLDELKRCNVAVALPQPPYDLTGIRDQDGDGKISVYDYVDSQVRTFGDFQGDGECPTRGTLP